MKRKLIGKISVDTGTVLIIDPAYAEYLIKDEVQKKIREIRLSEKSAGQINQRCDSEQESYFELCVVSSTGYGDGTYPVYAEYEQDEFHNDRVIRLIIEFGYGGWQF